MAPLVHIHEHCHVQLVMHHQELHGIWQTGSLERDVNFNYSWIQTYDWRQAVAVIYGLDLGLSL